MPEWGRPSRGPGGWQSAGEDTREKIEDDDAVVVDTVREGMEELRGAKGLVVRIHPSGEGAVTEAREGLASEFPAAGAIEVRVDEGISPGGALIQSANGEIDLRIETQLDRLRRAAESVIGLSAEPVCSQPW